MDPDHDPVALMAFLLYVLHQVTIAMALGVLSML